MHLNLNLNWEIAKFKEFFSSLAFLKAGDFSSRNSTGMRTKGRTCLKKSHSKSFSVFFFRETLWILLEERNVTSFLLPDFFFFYYYYFLSLQMESSAGKRRRGWSFIFYFSFFISVSGCAQGDWQVIGNAAPAFRMNDHTHFPYWKMTFGSDFLTQNILYFKQQQQKNKIRG